MNNYDGCDDFADLCLAIVKEAHNPHGTNLIDACVPAALHFRGECNRCHHDTVPDSCRSLQTGICDAATYQIYPDYTKEDLAEVDLEEHNKYRAEWMRKHFRTCKMCESMLNQAEIREMREYTYKIMDGMEPPIQTTVNPDWRGQIKCQGCGQELGDDYITKGGYFRQIYYHKECEAK